MKIPNAASLILAFCLAMPIANAGEVNKALCTFNGIPLRGKVKFVNSFPDIKIQVVSSFPDLNVQKVSAFPDSCGQWQIVDSFPDFTVQIVSSFPDVKVKWVSSFPGVN
ncbi:hypothetical protein UC34_08850 [Pandoraea vervacti]|uniref:7(1) septoil knot domain-containing protein n=1 Tax=Pandoraea vervacti TaxID=656178 RepID=A0ABM5T3L5_9BURK|nr:hypothetical protein [Pandoraea vervacti]AJP59571.2 hypothetical protein UC34_08850 [Pandoraea vervacti]